MTKQKISIFKKREKIYRRTACNNNQYRILKMGCCATACWYYCEKLCIEWELNHKKNWGMHDEYNTNIPLNIEKTKEYLKKSDNRN